MFRTDFQDDEGDEEWAAGSVSGNRDGIGDDDVVVSITSGGAVTVQYE